MKELCREVNTNLEKHVVNVVQMLSDIISSCNTTTHLLHQDVTFVNGPVILISGLHETSVKTINGVFAMVCRLF